VSYINSCHGDGQGVVIILLVVVSIRSNDDLWDCIVASTGVFSTRYSLFALPFDLSGKFGIAMIKRIVYIFYYSE